MTWWVLKLKKGYLLATLFVALTLVGAVQFAFAQQQKVFVIGTTTDLQPADINPVKPMNFYYAEIVFPELLAWDKDGKEVPGLAQSWTISPDGMTYTYKLRENAKWSDGQPVTSDDVAFTALLESESNMGFFLYFSALQTAKPDTVTGFTLAPGTIETPDAKTVIFHLLIPSGSFFTAAGGFPIFPKHIYEGLDLATQNLDVSKMVGSGPYVPTELVPGDRYVLVANQYYWGGRPTLDKVIFKIFRDTTSAEIALESGAIDLLMNVPGTDVKALEKVPNITIGVEQPQLFAYFVPNFRPKLADGSVNPCADLRVRKAIAMSMDLPSILDAAFGKGYYVLANQIFVPNMYYLGKRVWNDSIPMPAYPYDPVAAGKLLDEAGYPADANGIRMKLTFITPSAGRLGVVGVMNMMQLIQHALRAVGIDMQQIMMEYASYRARYYMEPPKDWNVAIWSQSQSPDPTNVGYNVNGVAWNIGKGGWNGGGYNNPYATYLVSLGDNTTDRDARVAIYQRIAGIAYQDVVNIPLYYPIEVVAWNSKWQGIVLGLDNPCCDYWGAIKYQNLAQLTVAPEAMTSTTSTAAATPGPDYTTLGIIAVLAVIVIGALGYYFGRRGKKAA
jgi:peptide/nickel transport system substrate-binding protein